MSSTVRLLVDAARGREPLVLLDGIHAVKHAVRFGARIHLVATDDRERTAALVGQVAPDIGGRLESAIVVLDRGQLAGAVGRLHPTGVVAVADRPDLTAHPAYRSDPRRAADRRTPVLMLEEPGQAGNVGAVIRAGAALSASGVVLLVPPGGAPPQGPPPERPGAGVRVVRDPFARGVLRGAAGLHWALPVVTASAPTEVEGPLVVLDPTGPPIVEVPIPSAGVLCLGNERRGVSAELRRRADLAVSIPMRPGVSSLNLATAAAVSLFAARAQDG